MQTKLFHPLMPMLRVWATTLLVISLGLTLAQCDGDSDDPDAQSIENLNYPFGLKIRDDGAGTITLFWNGSNAESDFDGFNIYGVANDGTLEGFTEGAPIELLDESGEPLTAAKTTLQQFHYNPDEPFVKQTTLPTEDEETDFSFLPIHQVVDGEALLPTCKTTVTSGTASCALTSADNKDNDAALNGQASYEITGLTPGTKYCFTILASMNGGKDVSGVSSEVRCVVPRFKLAAKLNGQDNDHVALLVNAIRTACATECPDISALPSSSDDYRTVGISTDLLDSDSTRFQVESYSSTGVYFVNGKLSAIQDLGYYANGFTDANLPGKIPELTWDSNGLQNKNGWTVPGQSILLNSKHIYAVASAGTDVTAIDSDTQFYYDLIYVSGDLPAKGTEFDVEVRLASAINER